jgi:hypothetical protein
VLVCEITAIEEQQKKLSSRKDFMLFVI